MFVKNIISKRCLLMDNNSLRMGYVMVSRALLLDIYGKRGAADGEEEAFLRVLTHVNYRDTTVLHGGVQVACGRGESVISFLGWSDILGWTRAHTRRFFEHCFAKGSIEKVVGDLPCHIRVPGYDAWTGSPGGKKQPGERLVDEALQVFIARYSEVTHLPIENKGQISKAWKRLSTRERGLATERIEDYYYNLDNVQYCYRAVRYLESKVFENEFCNSFL